MKYLILNTKLDTFASQGGRVLFCKRTDFLPDYQVNFARTTLSPPVKVSEDLSVIVSDDLAILNLSKRENSEFITLRQLIGDCDVTTANLLSKAIQLVRFYQDHHFCSRCGTATQLHLSDIASICPACDYHQYPRIQPCIITAIVKHENDGAKLLLAHHHRAKSSGMYGLIAGFVEVGESLEQCVQREAIEEVGLTVKNLRYMASQPWAFPSNLMMGFIAEYDSGNIHIQKDELIHADFFALDNLPKIPPKGSIAFDLIMSVKKEFAG